MPTDQISFHVIASVIVTTARAVGSIVTQYFLHNNFLKIILNNIAFSIKFNFFNQVMLMNDRVIHTVFNAEALADSDSEPSESLLLILILLFW